MARFSNLKTAVKKKYMKLKVFLRAWREWGRGEELGTGRP
jgi:hypothetical protein